MKKILTFGFFSFLLFSSFAYRSQASVYEINLRYDTGRNFLSFADEGGPSVRINPSKDISPVEFYQEETDGQFTLVFIDNKGNEIVRKNFDGLQKTFSIETPYYSFAKFINVYRSDLEQPILSYDLSDFSTCNQNSVCEFEKGENINSCLPDCVATNVDFSSETGKLLDENKGIIKDPQTGEVLLRDIPVDINVESSQQPSETPSASASTLSVILMILGGVIVVVFVVMVVLYLRNRHY